MTSAQYNTLYDLIGFFTLASFAVAVVLFVSVFLTRNNSKRFLFAVSTGIAFYTASELYMSLSHLQQSIVASQAGFSSIFAFSHWGMTLLGLTFFYPLYYYLLSYQYSEQSSLMKPFIGISFLMGITGYTSFVTFGWIHWVFATLSIILWVSLFFKFHGEIIRKKYKFSHSVQPFIKVHYFNIFSWFLVGCFLISYPYLVEGSMMPFYASLIMVFAVVFAKFGFSLSMVGLAYEKK